MNALARIRALGLRGYCDSHVELMADTVARLEPTHIFEWGTNWGESARIWYELAGEACEIHTVDRSAFGTPCGNHPGCVHGHWILGLDVYAHTGEGCETTVALHGELQPDRALVYIDDDHEYAPTLAALTRLAQECPGAVLLVHDSAGQEPHAAITKFLRIYSGCYDLLEDVQATGMVRLWPLR